jgi:hypothetical protein
MTTVVIIPGGFHPFHAGHAALYNSARRAFPDAKVFVAATNDTSARPFPFAVKEKLAKLAGVEPGHFVQVKSPFRAEEITAQFDPAQDRLIFVRSEKDANKPPQAGGVKKDGSPAYLQPLMGARRLEPFARHAYMAYLPTVEFGPGMTSATEIRAAWPRLNDQRKTALVMSLYPKTQTNPRLAATVVKLLDTAIGGELDEDLSRRGFLRGLGAAAVAGAAGSAIAQSRPVDVSREFQNMRQDDPRVQHNKDIEEMARAIYEQIVATRGQPIDRRQQQMWMTIAREKATEKLSKYAPGRPAPQSQSSGFPAQGSERRVSRNIDNFESQGVAEAEKKCPPATQDITLNLKNRQKAIDEYGYGPLNPDMSNRKFWMKKVDEWNLDSAEEAKQSLCGNCAAFDIRQDTLDCIAQGIDADSPADAEGVIDAGDLGYCKFLKFKCASRRTCDAWVTGGPLMDKPDMTEVDAQNFVGGMTASYQRRENQPVDEDYIDEKWSQKYKSSINCASPRGFSQRAHCQGRKK